MTIQQTFEQAVAHHQAGRLSEAEPLYRTVLRQDPEHPDALHLLGLIAYQTANYLAAVDLITLAIQRSPGSAEYRSHLGLALARLERVDEAISSYRQALMLQPDFAQVHNNLGNALAQKGLLPQAIESLERALRLWPDCAPACTSLGNVYYTQRRFEQSIAAHRKALSLQPGYAEAHNNLANALSAAGDPDGAIVELNKALSVQPDYADAHSNLGNILRETGQIEAAIASFRRAGAARAFDGFDSNAIYCMHFHPDYDTAALCTELALWNQKHALPLAPFIPKHPHDRNPDRRLRIGYVSPDFREHVVGWNLLPLLSRHDHRQFEIFCYSSVALPDVMTEKLKAHADIWRNVTGLSHQQVAGIIHRDQIDILVDLSLHSANHRLLLFAQKPAPLQLSYLGYCGSTGLTAIDYRFSDPYLDTQEDDQLYAEKTLHLPQTYWCYQPGGAAPPPGPLPASANGFITFGCLNNFAKVSDPALALWAKILQAIPQSKLLLHAPPGSHRDRAMEKLGVTPDRVEFVPKQSFEQYAQNYQRIDIALDPFPYNGGITTCDALYMGVPLITLQGNTAVGRAGKSILSNLQLPELIAQSPEQYQQIALSLAADSPRLAGLRATLRDRMHSSPLMNPVKFAKDVEAAYRSIWRQWCEFPVNMHDPNSSEQKSARANNPAQSPRQ